MAAPVGTARLALIGVNTTPTARGLPYGITLPADLSVTQTAPARSRIAKPGWAHTLAG